MCEGGTTAGGRPTGGGAGDRRSHRHRHYADDLPPTPQALDEVPPVAALTPSEDGWQPAVLNYRTPQHLGTLTTSSSSTTDNGNTLTTPPVLVAQRFLAAGYQHTEGGRIGVWDLAADLPAVKQRRKRSPRTVDTLASVGPTATVRMDSPTTTTTTGPSPVVQLVPLDNDDDKDEDSTWLRSPGLVAANAVGQVSIVWIVLEKNGGDDDSKKTMTKPSSSIPSTATAAAEPDKNMEGADTAADDDDDNAAPRVRLQVAACWNTGRCGVSSVVVVNAKENKLVQQRQLLLGYQSGHLEAWSLPLDDVADDDDDGKNHWLAAAPQLQWRGMFGGGNPPETALQDGWMMMMMNPPQPARSITGMAELLLPAWRVETKGDDDDDSSRNNKNGEEEQVAAAQLGDSSCSSDPKSTLLATPTPVPLQPQPQEWIEPSGATAAAAATTSTARPPPPSPPPPPPVYLVVSLHQNESSLQPARRPPTASMVEVVDLASVEAAWKNQKEMASKTTTDGDDDGGAGRTLRAGSETDDGVVLPLEAHCVLPEAGQEIVDASTIRSQSTAVGGGNNNDGPRSWPRMPQHTHWIPMMSSGGGGAGGVCSLSGRRSRLRGGGAGIALADGMVVVVSASTVSTTATTALAAGVDHDDNDPGGRPSVQQQQLRWGVSPVVDQYALAYPAVGVGFVAAEHKAGCRNKASSFVACCLRGTSTYLIPIDDGDGGASLERAATNSVPPPRPLIALSLPQDIEEDSAYRYVQSFTAGTLSMRRDNTNDGKADLLQDDVDHHQDEIPILIYAWPSGVVSVYSCELLQYNDAASDSRARLLRQLVADGSAELLRNILLSSAAGGGDDLDPQGGIGLADTAWNDARTEVRQFRGPVPLTVNDVCSSGNLVSFRSVLIRLSSESQRANEDRDDSLRLQSIKYYFSN